MADEVIDLLKRIDWCPGCGWRRLVAIVKDPTPEQYSVMVEAIHEDQREHLCCNPDCRGEWGTNCWHCHHPKYAPKPTRLRRLSKRRSRAAREANRSAARGLHYMLDKLAEKADHAEKDRDRLPSLPRWQRGEWTHIHQRTRGER